MARKTRTTTSVSTLVNNVHNVLTFAKLSKRNDIGKVAYDLSLRIDSLVKEYNAIRAELDPMVKLLQTDTSDFSMFASEEEEEAEV